jgi:small-conductance mechanosensitive channel
MPGLLRSTAAAILLLFAAGCLAAGAKAPAPLAPPEAGKTDKPAPAAQVDTEEIARARAAAEARLAAMEAAGDMPPDAPAGTPAFEISARLTMARQLVSLYDKQRNARVRLDQARQRRSEVERAMQAWRGFAEPPPRSVLAVDALRDEFDVANQAVTAAAETSRLLQRFEAQFSSKLKAAQGEARLAAEAADRARGTPGYARLDWRRNLSRLNAEVDSATQALLQIGLSAAQADHEVAVAQRDFARHGLIAAGSELALPPADLERVIGDIELRRLTTERALRAASKTAAEAQAALAAIERQQAAESAALHLTGPGGADRAGEALIAREVAVTADQKVFLLREQLTALEAERSVWEGRSTALGLKDPVQARAIYERLKDGLAGLRASRQYLEQQLAVAAGRLRDEEARRRLASAVDMADRRLLDTLRERETDLRVAIEASAPMERLVAHFQADFEGRRDITLAERVKDIFASAWLAVRQVWNHELFSIEDTMQTADGRKLTVARSVTIGKSFGAVLIVVAGYLAASFVVRWIERRIVAARRFSPQGAALARKWILFALTSLLAVFALFSASIPLTAFAFLGGALAIAAGFGLQTLLKNLVSGVMLLVERPLRLGDLVEVDNLRGRVTEIGLRASTIRSGDGTESMVPNSRFLEGNMTNWTYSNPTHRQTITLGVAYGSPLRRVNEILNDVLARHGLVLKVPPPQVYLEGYGDSSISFALNYWVEMTEQTDVRRVKSDLLHMIDRAFEEAAIQIPFPQREVRLSTAVPMSVAVVPPATGRAAG